MSNQSDPILAKRAQVQHWVTWGLRTGYGLFILTTVLFVIAALTDFTSALSVAMTVCLVVGSLILAPSIVFSYGVKAADRADRDGTW